MIKPIEWRPRSPHYTPLDFFLVRLLENEGDVDRPPNLWELEIQIILEISRITSEVIRNIQEECILDFFIVMDFILNILSKCCILSAIKLFSYSNKILIFVRTLQRNQISFYHWIQY